MEENKYSKYTISQLMENAENAFDMILSAEDGKFQWQTTNFDVACFCDRLIPLNVELKKRKIEPIPMHEKAFNEAVKLYERDYSYDCSIPELKANVPKVKSAKASKPAWFVPIPQEESIPSNTTADKILGGN